MTSGDSLVLGDGNGVVGVVVIAADLLHLQMAQDTAEDDVEELDAVGVLHHAHVGDGQGGLGAVRRPGHHDGDSLGRGEGSGAESGMGVNSQSQ